MDADSHPDPFQDALQQGMRRVMEVGYAAAAGAQVYLQHQKTQARVAAERDERVRRVLNAQIRADRDAARAGWAPALDPHWLAQADLPQAARAWGAAMPYADRAVALVRAGRCDRDAQMRGTAPRAAPVRHGPLRPAPRRRNGTGRGDA